MKGRVRREMKLGIVKAMKARMARKRVRSVKNGNLSG